MDKSRILEILLNFIAYCEELKERDSAIAGLVNNGLTT